MSSLSTTVMRHSLVGRRCLSLFATMVPAVPAPSTTWDLMVVVMLRRYPHGYLRRCERRDTSAVTCETKACLTRGSGPLGRQAALSHRPKSRVTKGSRTYVIHGVASRVVTRTRTTTGQPALNGDSR